MDIPNDVSSEYVHPRFLDIARELLLSPSFLHRKRREKTFREGCAAAGVRPSDIDLIDAEEFKRRQDPSIQALSEEDLERYYDVFKSKQMELLASALSEEEKLKKIVSASTVGAADETKKGRLRRRSPRTRLTTTGRVHLQMNQRDRRFYKHMQRTSDWNRASERDVERLNKTLREADLSYWRRRPITARVRNDHTRTMIATNAWKELEGSGHVDRLQRRKENLEKERRRRMATKKIVYNMRRENAQRTLRRKQYQSTKLEMQMLHRRRQAQMRLFRDETQRSSSSRAIKARRPITARPRQEAHRRNGKLVPISMYHLLQQKAEREHREAVRRKMYEDAKRDAEEMEAHMKANISKQGAGVVCRSKTTARRRL